MELKEIFNNNPYVTSISLKNKQIGNSKNILNDLTKFKELIDLDLSGNSFKDLPNNLSSLQKLKSLDLTENEFIDVSFFLILV